LRLRVLNTFLHVHDNNERAQALRPSKSDSLLSSSSSKSTSSSSSSVQPEHPATWTSRAAERNPEGHKVFDNSDSSNDTSDHSCPETLPSIGSVKHFLGEPCQPCAFAHSGKCHMARKCKRCHYPHGPPPPRPSKSTRRRADARALAAAAATDSCQVCKHGRLLSVCQDCARDASPAEAPTVGAASAPSVSLGADMHNIGRCQPCAMYFRPTGCTLGSRCRFCHMCPEGTVEMRRGERVMMMKANGAGGDAASSGGHDGPPRGKSCSPGRERQFFASGRPKHLETCLAPRSDR